MRKILKPPRKSTINFYHLRVFILGRRKSLWMTFRRGFSERLFYYIWRIFFSKNIIHERSFRKKSGLWADDIFAFRNQESKEKFLRAKKLSWDEDFAEKSRLYGEALDYPEFAIDDFIELSRNPQKGDRIGVKCFSYGIDGFICRPENFEKLKSWLVRQKIPLEKVIISDNETSKWRPQTLAEFEEKFTQKSLKK